MDLADGHDFGVNLGMIAGCWSGAVKIDRTCPSCHQKRTLLTSRHVAEDVCSPVAHRQVVLIHPHMIGAIQTHGQLLHWHPHLHVLIARGDWTPEGEFLELPEFEMRPRANRPPVGSPPPATAQVIEC